MNKTLILTALAAVAYATAPAAVPGPTGSTIYGFQSYADIDGFVGGFCSLDPEGSIDQLWEYPYSGSGAAVSNGWIRNGKLCGLGILAMSSEDLVADYAYQEFNLQTGEMTVSRHIDTDADFLPYFYTAAYSPDDDRIYGYGRVGNIYESEVYAFKSAPADKPEEARMIAEITPGDRCYSLCWHPVDKCFYGVTSWGKFVKVLKDGTTTALFDVPVDNLSNSPSGLVYSPFDGYLLWNPAVMENVSHLYAIYPDEKRIEDLHTYDVDRQFTFFLSPDFNVADSSPAAAAYLGANFIDASTSGTLSYTMPARTLGDQALSGELGWNLYANGALLKSGTAQPGAKVDVAVDGLNDAYYTFRFEATLNSLPGVPCVSHLFVGNDTPKAPAEVVLALGKVSWTAVTEGVHGGYVDLKALSYEVSLNGTVLGNTTATSYEYALDDNIELDAFRASVVAVASGKRSEAGVSEKALMGHPKQLPLTIAPTEHDAELVTIINADGSPDYGVWRYSEAWDTPCFASGWSYDQPDDWLILPVTHFPDASVAYTFAVEAARGGAIGTREYFEVWAGTEPTPEALTIPVMAKTRAQKYNQWIEYSAVFAVPAAGDYYVAIRSVSDPDQKDLIVRNIRIAASSETVAAPEAVSDLTVVDSSNENLTATLSFTLPSKYIDGSDIPASTTVKATVHAAQDCSVEGTPGSQLTITVPTAQGDNYITVTTSVDGHDGRDAEVVVFTGMDVLSYIENYTSAISEDNMSILLKWAAPKESINGGYFSTTGINYWVGLIDTDGTFLDEPVLAGTDVYEYTYTLAPGTPQQQMRIAVVAENAAGLSPARWYISQIAGTPYTLPLIETFEGMAAAYNPLISQAPSAAYQNGTWTWCQPELVDPSFATETPGYALIGYTDEGNAAVRMRLPKVSTAGLTGASAEFEVWTGKNAASNISVYALTYGMTSPTRIATIPAGTGWTKARVTIPDQFVGRPWMNLYIDGTLSTAETYLILNSYRIDDPASAISAVADGASIYALDGEIVLSGFDGQAFAVSTIDGRVAASGTASAETHIAVAPGIYLVRAGATTARLIVR